MSVLFEDLMFCAFIIADIVLLIRTCKMKDVFSRSEKLCAIMFVTGYISGLVWQIAEENLLGVIFCITGLTLSQFIVAIVYYQSYKDLEIPHE